MLTNPPRALDERRVAALERLRGEHQLWLATSSAEHGAHLIPVSFVWRDDVLTMATAVQSRTWLNIAENGRARVALGPTHDVVVIDGDVEQVAVADVDQEAADAYARVSMDPRVIPGFGYLRMTPKRVLVWNGMHEFGGRTVMVGGRWLDAPVD